MLQIKKRTGDLVPFNKNKISRAIEKAYIEVYPTNIDDIPSYNIEFLRIIV